MRNQIVLNWRDLLAKFALVFFCFTLWPKGVIYWGMGMLVIAWLADGGISRLSDLIKEPLALGVLLFCGVWVLGLLWSDSAVIFQGKWRKYFILLTFIPLFSLLSRERLPWVTGALLCSYLGMVILGSYQWAMQEMQGISLLGMSYLHYSAALGIGVILAVFLGWETLSREKRWLSVLSWLIAILLLFLQFNQSARGILLATLMALLLMIVLRYRAEWRMLTGGLTAIMAMVILFATSSDIFHDRLQQAGTDLRSFQQGDYQTSVGYRLAMWDVGLHGIAEHPLLGHGSGMAKKYFDDSIITYKQGIYRNLPEFQETAHFHNELIEIGMHLGLLGILAFVFLLWCWFQIFRQNRMALLGSAIVCFICISGLTDTFLLYSGTPPFLLTVTAIAVCWRKYREDPDRIGQKYTSGERNGNQNPQMFLMSA
ncbi:MAG TPA: O-antigen ligase family protein [Nitrosomonas europaea]|uniref:O-antigen ligase family protein n=1 Tax=Nitrosomonas europaea TaxID=915 RepID=UPI0002F4647F|nr:O-antigen ligase family protein [Nitrosomonas europaea]SDW87748.1 O-antigen ligase [Nitrosomonas europaea]SET41117.1 O-antigen ligase [Nitrosomonas europaea]SJZ97553.1 O-antigen ligase [Nitrosomonas europaea]HUM72813.1 O-antigen ligase family protein [Nitrosomonas europaea]